MCMKHLCLEISEDMSRVMLKTVNGHEEALIIDADDLDEAVEILEEISTIASTALQYIKEVRYGKGYNLDLNTSV